jgi:parallel beta-helix repeat protein
LRDSFKMLNGERIPKEMIIMNPTAPSGTQSLIRISWMIMAGLTAFLVLCMPVSADTTTVCPSGCNFSSVQEAIDHASNGDTIRVMAGEYHELLTVNKTLTLIGEDPASTIIDGDQRGDVISLDSPGITIVNLTARGSIRYSELDPQWPGSGIKVTSTASDANITGCLVTDCQVGIYGDSPSRTAILKNTVYGNDWEGIFLDQPTSPTVSGNNLYDNWIGFMSLQTSESFSCTGNTLLHNQGSGLCFIDDLENAVIADNLIQDNGYLDFSGPPDYDHAGGYFEFMENCTCTNNTFVRNGGIGFFISGMKDTMLDGNVMQGNNAGFSYNDLNLAPSNTITLTNTVDGLPILYLEGVSDREITGADYASVYCVGVQDITVHDLVMDSANGLGITIRGGKNIQIRNNTVSNNLFQNILVAAAENAVLTGNRVLNGNYGSGVISSFNVTVSGNYAHNNSAGFAAAPPVAGLQYTGNSLDKNMVGFSFEQLRQSGDDDVILCNGNHIYGMNSSLVGKDLGILIYTSNGVDIRDNEIAQVYEGVFFYGGQYNTLSSCRITDSTFGIELAEYSPGFGNQTIPSCYNTVVGNMVSTEKLAFFTAQDTTGVYGNQVYLNSFISAEMPAVVTEYAHSDAWIPAQRDTLTYSWGLPRSAGRTTEVTEPGPYEENAFNTSTPVIYQYHGRIFSNTLGNYWNWYNGTDRDGDGVGRAPYPVITDNNDYYPLISPVDEYRVNPSPDFYADFTAEPLSGDAPLTVQFTDTSVGEPIRWYYQFGDGYSSSSRNPVHTYRNPGTYSVSLSIITMVNSKMVTTTTEKAGYITVKETPGGGLAAHFTAVPATGPAPLAVSFTDTSIGDPTGFRYSFGDLYTSASPDPVHTYRRPGNYDVQLTVWTTTGGKLQSNTTICRECITVT